MKAKLILILIISILLTSCASGLTPAPTAYPAPSTPTLVKLKTITPTPTKRKESSTPRALATWFTYTPQPTHTAPPTGTPFPTLWRDFTPTPNSTPGAWSEFFSSVTYANYSFGIIEGPLHFSIRYPPDWYLYPGYTVISAGAEWQGTYIQNYERSGDPDQPPLAPGNVQLHTGMGPCLRSLGRECPLDSPLLSPGLPGAKNIYERDHFTFWEVELYKGEFLFAIDAAMPGTPEENAELIQILEEILATVRLW